MLKFVLGFILGYWLAYNYDTVKTYSIKIFDYIKSLMKNKTQK